MHMKYTTEITVDLPRDEFIKKLDNPDNMKHWMQGLISHEMLSGEPGPRRCPHEHEVQNGQT